MESANKIEADHICNKFKCHLSTKWVLKKILGSRIQSLILKLKTLPEFRDAKGICKLKIETGDA